MQQDGLAQRCEARAGRIEILGAMEGMKNASKESAPFVPEMRIEIEHFYGA